MAGADLANIVNEAALLAARRNKKKVSMQDFEDAKDKVTLGVERRSMVITEQKRRTTAYHEAGHALVAWLLPGSDPVDQGHDHPARPRARAHRHGAGRGSPLHSQATSSCRALCSA